MSEYNMQVANTILQQLGGKHFVVTTGAKQLVAIDNGLRFRIGKNASKANIVRIILRADDTYNLEFWKQGQDVNEFTILTRFANKGLSRDDYNTKVKEAIARAKKNAEAKKLKAYEGIYCVQLQELFTDYTKLNTRLF